VNEKPQKGINPAKHMRPETRRKHHPSQSDPAGQPVSVPHGELPICCPESAQPTPQVININGERQCDPKMGGCGTIWQKKGD